MHIEPGVVDGAKIILSYGTATAALAGAAWLALDSAQRHGLVQLLGRSAIAALLVFCCFEVLPHHAVGVSEVHLIVGTTLFLLFGPAAAAIGLAAGLLAQGVFFAPADLPQYGMNVTTLLVPLFAIIALAKKIVAPGMPYVDLSYAQTLKLSAAYQGGIVAWVAFWAVYGQGFGAENLAEIASFGGAYLLVVTIEPLIDLGVLAIAKTLHGLRHSPLLERRLYAAHG
jgi:ABC-type Co2+ transport system permease subunit